MAEELEDPRPSRPEDHVNRAMKAVLSTFVSGPIMLYFNTIVGDPAQERRDDFMMSMYQRLRKLEATHAELRPEVLSKNPSFQATFLEAAQVASRTIQREKIDALRNAIINSAMHGYDESVRQMFVQCIERFTALHLSILAVLDDPVAVPAVKALLDAMAVGGGLDDVIEAAVPALKGRAQLTQIFVTDLESAGLLGAGSFRSMISPQGLRMRRTTDLGREFLAFVSETV